MSKISPQTIAKMRENADRTHGQAEFRGNENVPIQKGMNEDKLADHLEYHAQKGDQVGDQARDLINNHLSTGPWKITAGIHKGGLGGAQGGADPESHVTLSTGHHVRYNDKGIFEITGPGIRESKGRQGPSEPSDTENQLAHLKETHDLTDQQALKAHQYMTKQDDTGRRLPEHEAVAKAKEHSR
jgi:hypothetical protein